MLRRPLRSGVLRAAAREAARRPTPFYLFDPEELERRARDWLDAVSRAAPAGLFYPYKCNRAESVVRPLARHGIGAEVTTVPDFRRAWDLGLRSDRIVVHGPGKSRDLIDLGIAAGALFAADGREDALALFERGRALRKAPRYLLRLAVEAAEPEQQPFGIPARGAIEVARRIRRSRDTLPEGLAFHLGTGIPSVTPFEEAVREAAGVARELSALGVPLRVLDVGGGFASEAESRLDARDRPRGTGSSPTRIAPSLAALARRLLGPGTRVLFEPGRALVSGSVHLVSRVVRVKTERVGARVFLDGSRLAHAFFAARGVHPIAVIPSRRGSMRRVALAGPLGVGLDLFAESARLPPIESGDLVVIGAVGAYNWNAASAWAGPIPPMVVRPV